VKTKEKFIDNHDGTFTVQKQYDNTPYLERTQFLRSMGAGKLPDSWCVGSIPMHLLAQWMKEENVDWTDTEGRKKLIMRKLNDPDFKKLRIVEGRV
jgi:ABC-type glycerol-3-phosphate transport system substrate-binding protein